MCPDNLAQFQIHKLSRVYKYDDDKLMMNCFCGMVVPRKAFSFISSWDYCQRFSSSQISNTPRARFEPAQNLSLGLAE